MITTLWRRLKAVIIIALLILALIFGGLFASENPGLISPVLLGFTLPNASVGAYLCLATAIGVLIGSLISYFGTQGKMFRIHRDSKSKTREIKQLQTELSKTKG